MARSDPRRRWDSSEPGDDRGIPAAARREFERRGELVRIELELERGSLESLMLLLEVRHGEQTIDEAVREAVRWLLAREARSIVEVEAIEARRRERERREAASIAYSREERDVVDQEQVLELGLEIAKRKRNPPGGVV